MQVRRRHSLTGTLAVAFGLLIPAGVVGAADRSYVGGFASHRGTVILDVDTTGGKLFFRPFEVGQLRLHCSDGTPRTRSTVVRDRVRLDDERRFGSEGRAGDRDDGVVKRVGGVVRSRAARGRFRIFKELRGPENVVCETPRLSWTAQRIGGGAHR